MKKIVSTVLVSTVVFFAWLPVISFAASYFYVDDGGNVGIGNSSPQAKLDVSGAMYSRLVTASSSTINWNAGNVQEMTLTSSPTLTFSNGQAGGKYNLILLQDGTGGRTVTWPASVIWAGGTAPALTSSANATDTVSFLYDGDNYLGTYNLDFKPQPIEIGFDNVTEGGSSSFSFTNSGSLLLVGIYVNNSSPSLSVTYNGTSMTQVAESNVSNANCALFALSNPPTGTHTVAISGDSYSSATAISYTGVSLSSQPESEGATSGTGSLSKSLSQSANAWLVGLVTRPSGTWTPTAGTIRNDTTDEWFFDLGPNSAGTNSIGGSSTGIGYSLCAVSIAPGS